MYEALSEGADKHSPLIKLYKTQVDRRKENCARSMPSKQLRQAFQEGGTGFTEMGRLGLALKEQSFISRKSFTILSNGFILFADPAVTTKPDIVYAEE